MTHSIRPLLLSSADIDRVALPLGDVVDLVDDTYRMGANGGVDIPAKVGVHPHGPKSFLHAMPAWVPGIGANGGSLGMKWVSFFPQNAHNPKSAQKDLPTSSALIVLNDPDSGLPVAIMEGMWVTYARTAACAALAAKYAANPMPRKLGLVGCGGTAEWSVKCISEVFPSIDEIFVTSSRPETRKTFCESMSSKGNWKMYAVDTPREAVEHMDIVISAVPKLDVHPIKSEWLSPGTVMIPIDVTGSWDDDVLRSVDDVICDHRGNLETAFKRYRSNLSVDDRPMISIDDIVLGKKAARTNKTDRVLAFMTGIGSIDMTIAWEIYRRAEHAGLGTHFAFT